MSIRVNGKVIASNGDVKTETDNLVTTDTNQTITAEKTFTTQLPILIERDVNQQQIPTASVAGQIVLLKNKTYTKGDGSSGWVQCVRSSTGDTTSSIAVRRFLDSDSEEITNDIGVTVAPNGVSYAYTSRQTPNEAPDNAIVTKGYVDSKSGGLELLDITFAPLGIDESKNKRRYLNGQVLIQEQFPAFTAAVKARMTTMANAFTTEVNWQAEKTQSKLGQCGKFVVDDTAGTIRLPCVVNAQGLVDLALIGGIKSESLPNIIGAGIFTTSESASGAVFDSGPIINYSTGSSGTLYQPKNGGFSASRSSSTYQNSAPVQQEAIQYPYCIVVNTGVEESDRPINNYQVNNVYSYGMSQYYKGTMNNNSWLKSAGQWNDGTVYTGMYNWLLEQVNADVSGFVASTAAYTDYDFVINTADQTFRLPLLDGSEDLPSDRYDNLTISVNTQRFTAPANGIYTVSGVGFGWVDIANETSGDFGSCSQPRTPDGYGRYTLKAKRSDQIVIYCSAIPNSYVCRFIYAKGNGSLYYYVGDTLQNAQLINVARIEEKFVNFVDKTSTTDRELAVGWGMPDYSAGVAKNRNTAYTAEMDGLLFVCFSMYQTAGNANYMTINNVVVHGKELGGNSGGGYFAVYPLSKNDSWTFTTPSNQGEIMFYPLKGVK